MIAWRIALRYLVSKKSHSAVSIISAVAVAGVAVATAAIVIVLSVFNGFTEVAASRLSAVDPELRIEPLAGKAFQSADSVLAAISGLPEIARAAPVVQERGLLISGSRQKPVVLKGIPDDYALTVGIDSAIIDGAFEPESYGYSGMLTGVGVALGADARPGSLVRLYVPKRVGRINVANPQGAFAERELLVTGVFETNQQEYDAEYVYVPIEVARGLLEYSGEATAIEASIAPGAGEDKAVKAVEGLLGDGAKVLTRAQQEESSYRMIMIEKWITFLMLAFILVIASFNIMSTLSLMVIEKSSNSATLRALGATRSLVRRVFMWQGFAITVAGGIAGVALGTALSVAQQYGGFIRLAGDPTQLSIAVYPVHVEVGDLAVVLALTAAVSLLASLSTIIFASDKESQMK